MTDKEKRNKDLAKKRSERKNSYPTIIEILNKKETCLNDSQRKNEAN